MARGKLKVVEPPEEPEREEVNTLTVEELARTTGLTVRNIRSHQARGLLPPPEVRVRVGYYGPEHVERLRLVGELQEEGLTLRGIQRLLAEEQHGSERLLQVRRAASAAAETETPEVVTAGEVRERLGLEGEEGEKLLARARKLGLLVPVGEDHLEAPSPELLGILEEVVSRGIAVGDALEVLESVTNHSRRVARKFVERYLEDVWKPFTDAGLPEERWPDVVETMERLRPIAAQTLLAVFRLEMSAEVEAALAQRTKRLSEGKR